MIKRLASTLLALLLASVAVQAQQRSFESRMRLLGGFFLLEKASTAPHLSLLLNRAVAQLGSALEWGSRGRGFESRRPDHFSVKF